jgi:hypothetical protein
MSPKFGFFVVTIIRKLNKQLNISCRAFWDVDFQKLMKDPDNYAAFIIRKVFLFGTFDDVIKTIRYFGKEKTSEILKNSEFLPDKTVVFSAALLNLEKQEFKCFTKKQHPLFYSKP